MRALIDRYLALRANGSDAEQRLAARQLARLTRAQAPDTTAPSPWARVPLADLFAEAGNIVVRAGARLECGHEPLHRSSSGRCVVIYPAAGRWYCRSCRRGGDAVTLLCALHCWAPGRAARKLTLRFGRPAVRRQSRRAGRVLVVEVGS